MNKISLVILAFLGLTFVISCDKETVPDNQIKETFYLRNGDADMPVFMRGNVNSKDIIVYLHGGPGGESSTSIYTNSFLQLQQRYKVAFLDQRQQGNAHGHIKLKDIKFETFTEDVHLLVRVLKRKYGNDSRIYILGHSWGGTLGTGFMINEDYQKDVHGYIQVAGAYDLPLLARSIIEMVNDIGNEQINLGKDVQKWRDMINEVNKLDKDNLTIDDRRNLGKHADEIWMNEMLTSEIYDIPSKIEFEKEYKESDPVTPKSFDEFSYLPNSWSIAKINYGKGGLTEKVLEISMVDDLYKITKPTLLIWGKYDFTVPPKLGEVALEKISSSEKSLKIYEHSGHSPMDSDPDRFADDIIEFIDNNK